MVPNDFVFTEIFSIFWGEKGVKIKIRNHAVSDEIMNTPEYKQ